MKSNASGNRIFIVVTGILGAITLLALVCIAAYALVLFPRQMSQREQQSAEINAQNTQVALAITQTSASAAFTATPTVTAIPSTPTRTATPVVAVPTNTAAAVVDPRTATVAAMLTQPAAGGTQPVVPTSTALPATGGGDYEYEESEEFTESTELSQEVKAGEIITTFPSYMSPGSSGYVLAQIIIPTILDTIPSELMIRNTVSPESVPIIGEIEEDKATIRVDEFMRVELVSRLFSPKAEYPQIQEVDLTPNRPTYWVWEIVAPESQGLHVLLLKVFLNEREDVPSWSRAYQILVLDPTSTPFPTSTRVPSATITPSPLPTNTPTETQSPTLIPTPIPTLTTFGQIEEVLIEGSVAILLALIPIFLSLLAWVGGVFLGYFKRKSEIENLQQQLKSTKGSREKKELQYQISRLEKIKWWQIWMWK